MYEQLKKHLDINELQEILTCLREVSGFGVLLIDPEEPTEIDSEQRQHECSLCRLAHESEAGRNACGKEFLHAAKEAIKWGEPYVYHCHLGLMEWVIPIIIESELVGIITCGQVVCDEKDDLFYHAVLEQAEKLGLDKNKLNDCISEIPESSGSKVRSTTQILRLIVEQLSQQTAVSLHEARSRQIQQAEIAEAMAMLQDCENNLLEDRHLHREIIGKVRLGDLPAARKILDLYLGSILLKSKTDMSILKAQVLELVVMLSRAAVEGGADIRQILGEDLEMLQVLLLQKTQEDICRWILIVIEKFTKTVFQTRNLERVKIISQGLNFIQTHYEENITLEDVAKEVGKSISFLKKVLREELGITFTEYLTRTRMEKSEEFLRNPTLSLTEIALMVGYNDQSYFGKIFKQYHGITPAQYRKKVI